MFSINNALDSLGYQSLITSDDKDIISSDGAVLPGVGSFPEAMGQLNELQLTPVIKEFVASGKPFMGICLGLQCAVIDFARNVCNMPGANSAEFEKSEFNVIDLMDEQRKVKDKGGTMRLGAYPCVLIKNTKAYKAYKNGEISERHRHRYELNNKFRKILEEHGFVMSGLSPDGNLVEIGELKEHPWFLGTQFHPELKSRAVTGTPLFIDFIKAALNFKKKKEG